MGTINKISRRNFLQKMGLASGGLLIGGSFLACSAKNGGLLNTDAAFKPNVFIQLNKDGSLILYAARSEMGQGVRTSLTSIIADEMDADWSRVTVKQAIGDSKYGDQNTDGSRSVRTFYDTMREIGATARAMLITAAAKKWEVPPGECTTENHFVIHKSSSQAVAFGDLVEIAATLEVPKDVSLKDPKDYKYIGKKLPSVDLKKFLNGSAQYGMDIRLPGMKFAAIARCPVTFGKVKSFDATEALKIPGVEKVLEIPRIKKPFGAMGGVAVIASNTWSAFQGKEALKISWDLGANEVYSSKEYAEEILKNVQQAGKEAEKTGNVQEAFNKAHKIVESTFQAPHLVHAPMEVPNAVASVSEQECIIYAPTQTPQTAQEEAADFLGMAKEQITVNVTFLGGGFGRKSKPDYVLEAVALSKEMKLPVQVVWTREDDIQHSYYHANSAQYLKAALDKNGNVTAWLHRTAYPSIVSTFRAGADHAAGFELGQGMTNLPYDIPNMQLENAEAKAHIRIGWMRSVYNIIHSHSVNVFIDELAQKAKKDPLEFRLNLIGKDRIIPSRNDRNAQFDCNTARLKNVMKRACENANWGRKIPKGHGLGLAVHFSFFTYVASVVEVSVKEGELKVHHVYTVIDCGRTVNQDTIAAQIEGSAIFGMSLAKYGKITAKNGAIEQSNFHNYQLIRMNEAPDVHVEIVESEEAPSGVGEPGVPPIAPAIVNAIAAATGKRYYNLPLVDEGLT